MDNFKDLTANKDKKEQTETKLEKMRQIVADEEKCKEIAQKLCAYISQK
jgi:hypothetical protein